MRKPLIHLVAILGGALFASLSFAQPSASGLSQYEPISLAQYLQVVKENNAIIGNKRLSKETTIAIKESLSLYQLRPSVSYTKGTYYQQVPYTPYSTPTSNTYGINFNLEGWGKRAARSEYGDAEIGRSEADFQVTEVDVQTVATLGYVDALRNRLLFNSYARAAKRMSLLASNTYTKDSALFLRYYENASAKELQFTSLGLLNYSGGALKTLPLPIGNMNVSPQDFNPDELIIQALNGRSDILAVQAAINSAEKNINMTKANRHWDVQPYISYTATPQYDSGGYTYTPQAGFSAGIQIPLPVNNFLQNSDIVQAFNQKLSLEMQLRDLKEQVRVQIMQALLQYDSAKLILSQANDAFNTVSKVANLTSAKDIMAVRDKEGVLIDAKTNHVKALINVWRQSGNYGMLKI